MTEMWGVLRTLASTDAKWWVVIAVCITTIVCVAIKTWPRITEARSRRRAREDATRDRRDLLRTMDRSKPDVVRRAFDSVDRAFAPPAPADPTDDDEDDWA